MGKQKKEPNIIVEAGEDRSRLIIAFTGFHGGLTMQPFEFFASTGLLGCSRILLRDPTSSMYLRGCPPDAPDFEALLNRLRQEIENLKPERITCVGTSSGGYAALLFGHLLKADDVHAFSPTVFASAWKALFVGDWHQVMHRSKLIHYVFELVLILTAGRPVRTYRNLQRVLAEWNGQTTYTIHVCGNNKPDVKRARHLHGFPHMTVAEYPCDSHQVAKYLVRQRQLAAILGGVAPGGTQ